jgi:signal transduction histidine kinase
LKDERRAGAPLVPDGRAPYQAAFEASPVPQLLLRGGHVVDANLAARRALGATREALVGRSARALLDGLEGATGGSSSALTADAAVFTPLASAAEGPDELVSWPLAGGGPHPGGRLGKMLASLPLLWFRIDAAGVFLDAHTPATAQLLAPPDAFMGRTVEEVLPPALARMARENLEIALQSDQPVRYDYPLSTDGAERWYQCHMARSGDAEVFTYVTDVTARKASEAALERAVEEARAAVQARSQFVATVSHEVRTPINGILGMAELLGDTDLDDEQQSYVAMLQNAGRALLNVINDVLDFSKIEAGHLRLQPTAFSPRDVVEGVMAMLAERAHARGVEVGAIIGHDVPPTVVADPTRIEQVLLNLVGNAIKFTPSGSIAVRVSLLRRTIGGLMLRYEIVDTGVGIAPEVLPRVFAQFEQGDLLATRRAGGTGLGLAICRRLAELMGGEISVESELGAGSTFRFDVPVGVPTESRPLAAEPVAGLTSAGRPLDVLAFAPGERLREQLVHELPALGARLWASGEWDAARARLEGAIEAGAAPELVIVQLTLNRDDNAARLAALSALPPGTELVVVTAFGRRDQLSALQDAPLAEVVSAPLRLADLRALLAGAAARVDPAA